MSTSDEFDLIEQRGESRRWLAEKLENAGVVALPNQIEDDIYVEGPLSDIIAVWKQHGTEYMARQVTGGPLLQDGLLRTKYDTLVPPTKVGFEVAIGEWNEYGFDGTIDRDRFEDAVRVFGMNDGHYVEFTFASCEATESSEITGIDLYVTKEGDDFPETDELGAAWDKWCDYAHTGTFEDIDGQRYIWRARVTED